MLQKQIDELPIVVYDNGGKTTDRYSIMNARTGELYNMSENATSPRGVNIFAGIVGDGGVRHPQDTGAQVVPTAALPAAVQRAILLRYP